jgi:orotidine-5'-phosphate decarboxylase
MNFHDKIHKICEKNNSLLCVGLDIDLEKIPNYLLKNSSSPLIDFNHKIIDETTDLVCAYKLNMAFYEQFGIEGIQLLTDTIDYIPKEVVIILDGKRNDIGNTAARYAKSLFNKFKADAVTLSPYLGIDSIQPFLEYTDHLSFILCRTSNKSATDFQDLKADNKPIYEHVARKIVEWNKNNNCGAIVGATYPNELKIIREIIGETIPLLIPGVGKQGGDIRKTIENGTNYQGDMAIINSSRGILYKDSSEKFAQSAHVVAKSLRDEINHYRNLKS